MKHNIIKIILGIILLTISPFILLAILGFLFVIFHMIGGVSFITGVQLFIHLIYSHASFFPYLTTIPVLMVLAALLGKNISKTIKLFSRR